MRPFPFQEEILDIIAAEREVQNKYRHLVVAATGTGKTMIAAFDYARVARQLGGKTSVAVYCPPQGDSQPSVNVVSLRRKGPTTLVSRLLMVTILDNATICFAHRATTRAF